MQNRRIDMNIAQPNLLTHQIYDTRADSARCFSGYSLLPRILNAELTVLTAWLIAPPPRLTSQTSIIFHKIV